MNIWNVCAGFRSPNGMYLNSNMPNGVVIVVFGMSCGCIGILLYARIRSSVEKIFFPCSVCAKSSRLDIGPILSSHLVFYSRYIIVTLRFFLDTMCNGDDYGLFDAWMIPSRNISSNSVLAAFNLSGANLRGLPPVDLMLSVCSVLSRV